MKKLQLLARPRRSKRIALEARTLSKKYEHIIADPICDFVMTGYQKYKNGEYKQIVPIFVCSKPDCGKLVMPERVAEKKCKDAVYNARKSNEFKKDERWLYRLSKLKFRPFEK